jgi:hypothetical protein
MRRRTEIPTQRFDGMNGKFRGDRNLQNIPATPAKSIK